MLVVVFLFDWSFWLVDDCAGLFLGGMRLGLARCSFGAWVEIVYLIFFPRNLEQLMYNPTTNQLLGSNTLFQ